MRAVLAILLLLPVLMVAAGPAVAEPDLERWRAGVGQVRELAERDVPAAYEGARRLQAELGDAGTAADRALVLNLLARVESYRAEARLADAHARQALALAIPAADRVGQAEAYLNIALNAVNLANIQALTEATQQGVAVLDGVDRADLLGEALLRMVAMHRRFGQFDLSVTTAMHAMEIAKRSGNPRALAFAHQGMAISYDQTNRSREAVDELKQMLEQAKRARSTILAAEATLSLGNSWTSHGDAAEGERLIRQAISLYRAANVPFGAARATYSLADFFRRAGRYAEARLLFDESLTLYKALPNKIAEWWVLDSRSRNWQAMGDLSAAWADAEQSHALATQIGLDLYLHGSLIRMASILNARGDYRRAYELTNQAMENSAKAARDLAGTRMNDLAARYEAESRNREIKDLRVRSEQQALLQRGLWALVAITLLLLTVSAAFLVRQRRGNQLLSSANARLRQSQNDQQAVLDAVPDLLLELGADGEYLSVHCSRPELLVAPVTELIGKRVRDVLPAEAVRACETALAEAAAKGRSSAQQYSLDLPVGRLWFEMWAARKSMGEGEAPRFVVLVRDITEHKRIQVKEAVRLRIFERLAHGAPLNEVLEDVIHYVEAALPNAKGCIMLADADGKRLQLAAGAHLPVPLRAALVACGEAGQTCGRRVFGGHTEILPDLESPAADTQLCVVARDEGIRASWTEPIRDAAGRVLGTFGVYRSAVGGPDEAQLDLLRRAIQLAAIAIEKHRIEEALRTSESRYREVFDNVSDSLVLLEVTPESELKVLEMNPTFERATGIRRLDVLGRPVQEVLPVPVARIVERYCRACLDSGEALEEDVVYDLPRGRRTFNTTLIPVRGASGAFVRIVGIGRDVTLREQHAELDRRLTHFASLAPGGVFVLRVDAEGMQRYLYASPGVETVLGLSAEALLGDASLFFSRTKPDERARVCRILDDAGASLTPCVIEFAIDHPVRGEAWVELRSQPECEGDGGLLWHGYVNDISERKRAERRLQESVMLLRALTSRRETAREEERKRIAREIHDELGQMLSALRLDLSVLRLRYEGSQPDLPGRIKTLLKTVDAMIQVVRNVATSLRPSALDMGLVPALEWLTSEFTRYTGIPCRLDLMTGPLDLDDSQAVSLFRVVQESLTNVGRHAEANSVDVRLDRIDDTYTLEIRDDGKGFDPNAPRPRSFGLMGMRERGLAIGGEVVFISEPGRGTTVRTTFPAHAPAPDFVSTTT